MAGWLAAGAVAAVVAIALLSGEENGHGAQLPPVREIALERAAGNAGCSLRRAGRRQPGVPAADGPPGGRATRPAAYRGTLPTADLVAAMRRGIVVLHYRAERLDEDQVEELEQLRELLPNGTILIPRRDMPFAVAATAHRRILGCPELDDRAVEAIRLFRGRYIGAAGAGRG